MVLVQIGFGIFFFYLRRRAQRFRDPVGRPVFRQMGEFQPDHVSSDCALAGHHIEQGMGDAAKGKVAHPLVLIAKAYGLL